MSIPVYSVSYEAYNDEGELPYSFDITIKESFRKTTMRLNLDEIIKDNIDEFVKVMINKSGKVKLYSLKHSAGGLIEISIIDNIFTYESRCIYGEIKDSIIINDVLIDVFKVIASYFKNN
jgi:hypothetical protein